MLDSSLTAKSDHVDPAHVCNDSQPSSPTPSFGIQKTLDELTKGQKPVASVTSNIESDGAQQAGSTSETWHSDDGNMASDVGDELAGVDTQIKFFPRFVQNM